MLTAVRDFSIDSKAKPEEDSMPREPSPPLWNITNSLVDDIVVIEHLSAAGNNNDYEDDDDGNIKKNGENKEPDEQSQKESGPENPSKEQKNPFQNVADTFGGENISLVVLPPFPVKHALAAKQRYNIFTLMLLLKYMY